MATETTVTTEPHAEERPGGLAASPWHRPRRRWLALACLILIPAVVYALSRLPEDSYEASAVVQVKGASVDTFLLIGETPVNSPPQQAIDVAARLVTTRPVAARAATAMPPPTPSVGAVMCGRRAKRSRRRHPHHHRAGPRRAALSPASECDGASSERSQGGSSPRADRRGGYGARASASDPLLGRAGEPRQPSAPAYEASGSASRRAVQHRGDRASNDAL